MNDSSKRWLTGLLAAATLASASPAWAREPVSRDMAATKRKELNERFKAWLDQLLRTQLGLNDQRAVAVEQVLQRSKEAKKVTSKDQKEQRQLLRDLLAQNSND